MNAIAHASALPASGPRLDHRRVQAALRTCVANISHQAQRWFIETTANCRRRPFPRVTMCQVLEDAGPLGLASNSTVGGNLGDRR